MSSKFENIFRINRKSLFATLGGFKTSGAFFQGILIFEAQGYVKAYIKFYMILIKIEEIRGNFFEENRGINKTSS